jgi:hypothetical protein
VALPSPTSKGSTAPIQHQNGQAKLYSSRNESVSVARASSAPYQRGLLLEISNARWEKMRQIGTFSEGTSPIPEGKTRRAGTLPQGTSPIVAMHHARRELAVCRETELRCFPIFPHRCYVLIVTSHERTWGSVQKPRCAVFLFSLYILCADSQISLKHLRRFAAEPGSDHSARIGLKFLLQIFLGVHGL